MKKALLLALATLSLGVSANVQISETLAATEAALELFVQENSADTVNKYNGIKAWPTSGGIKVKIYVKGENSVDYGCHRHSANEPYECH